MQTRTLTISILLFACLAIACVTTADAEGPLRKRFMQRGGPPLAGNTSDSWQMPGGRLMEGTQNAFQGARDRLAFWRNNDEPSSNEFVEGTGRFFRPDLARREEENRSRPFSFVRPASWFEEEPPTQPGPQSVHDWIGQDRPGFE